MGRALVGAMRVSPAAGVSHQIVIVARSIVASERSTSSFLQLSETPSTSGRKPACDELVGLAFTLLRAAARGRIMYRINFFAIMSVGLVVVGCTVEASITDVAIETTGLTATGMTISAATGIADEHCRVHTTRAAQWPAGRQLLIYRGTTLRGACTVDGGGTIGANTIEMTRTMMMNRVWLGDGMDPLNPTQIVASITGVTVRNEVPSAPTAPQITAAVSTTADLEVDGDDTMREYTTTPTGTTGITVGYTTPHPTENPVSSGLGRSYLGWKAAQGKLDAAHDAFWTLGWRGNRGHCTDDPEDTGTATICDTKRFHITGTELSFASYPGLATLASADLDYAVSLHGQGAKSATTCNTNIMVGGLVGNDLTSDPLGFRRGVAENLRLLVPAETVASDGKLVPGDVKYSHAGNLLDGCNFDEGVGTTNYVNVLAQDGTVRRGLQLEQGSALTAATYQAVGESVHQIFDCLNATPDVDVGTVASSFAAQNSSLAGYATDGNHCNGFIVDAKLSTSSDDFFGGLQHCQVGGKVHLDVYHRNAAGSWDRVAGGTRTYTACGPDAFTDAAYDDDGVAPAPSFQHALTGAASAGDFRLVIYGYSGAFFTPTTALPVFGQAS